MPNELKLNIVYSSGVNARTELHGGGFFYVLSKRYLKFMPNGVVQQWSELIHDADAYNKHDPAAYSSIKESTYTISEHGRISYEMLGSKYTGIVSDVESGYLVLHAYHSHTKQQENMVFKAES